MTFILCVFFLCHCVSCMKFVYVGSMPSSIGTLTGISHLDLSSNSFKGMLLLYNIPVICSTILLSRNYSFNHRILNKLIAIKLCDKFMEWLEYNWQEKSVNAINSVGAIPSSIGSLTNLNILTLSFNCFTGLLICVNVLWIV